MFCFFNDTATTEIYTLSLHDALPILACGAALFGLPLARVSHPVCARDGGGVCVYDVRWERGASRLRKLIGARSEEHTSELQSRQYLVCRLLLEKKKHHVHIFHAPS